MKTSRSFDASAITTDLTEFQRDTVEHVISRFYGPDRATRFLVADETGLGKTMVARGVIARAIEELEHDDDVDRIDIVYVCSNADIAHQNLEKLDVTGDPHHGIASRLTLLAKHSRRLNPEASTFTKPVNLISFTPGTSFESGWQTGKAEERAMLYLLLEQHLQLTGWRATAAARLLQAGVAKLATFQRTIDYLRHELHDEIDPTISRAFLKAARNEGQLRHFDRLINDLGRRHSVPSDMHDELRRLIGALRATLARESVQLLEPDLVILDEFQRFRHLLDPGSEAGELAHHLFDYEQARVLLLSATPYKPFTYAEESQEGDDHHANFMETIEFLAKPLVSDVQEQVASGLRAYRDAVVSGQDVGDVTAKLRSALLKVMTRTERPKSLGKTMGREKLTRAADLPSDDLRGYVALRALAREVGGVVTLDYWKSAPYFVNFMDGYKIAGKVRDALSDPERSARIVELLEQTQHLTATDVHSFHEIDMGNARLRQLSADTVGAGWWKLLWLPPTLPYLVPQGPFGEEFTRHMTKRLVFSSWTATPSAIASLLSYDADRRTAEGTSLTQNTPEARKNRRSRLTYRLDPQRRPQSMTSLALFWPMPGLASMADPRNHARTQGAPVSARGVEESVVSLLSSRLVGLETVRGTAGEASYWIEAFCHESSVPDGKGAEELVSALAGLGQDDDEQEPEDQKNLLAHVEEAINARARLHLDPIAPDVPQIVAELAAHSPGNVAYRALQRITDGHAEVTEWGLWQAAAHLASSLRSLFAKPETTVLLDKLMPKELPYWRAILGYSAWGNLQAVMDEYLHHLATAERSKPFDDESLFKFAARAGEAVALRSARYEVFDVDNPEQPLRLNARFALRYGGRKQDQESARQPQVRQAFNSPFWPFVLATTSVGQEGIDFHWWCHSLLHWNTPANPVDFEQREGRIDRYDGHAVRRNIVERHGDAILASEEADPWRAAYRLADDEVDRLGEFAPHWVYPGGAHIERHIAPYALSTDEMRLEQIKRDVALYRLTFGQPRQEDMLALLQMRQEEGKLPDPDSIRLDLRAPSRHGS